MAEEVKLRVKNESNDVLKFPRGDEKIEIEKGKEGKLDKAILLSPEFQSALVSGKVSFETKVSDEEAALGREVLRQLLHPVATQFISTARNLESARSTLAVRKDDYNAARKHAIELVKAARQMAPGAEHLAQAVEVFLSTVRPKEAVDGIEKRLKEHNKTVTSAERAPSESKLEEYVAKRKALEAELVEARRVLENAERALEAEFGPMRRSLLEAAKAMKDADERELGREIKVT